MSIQAQGVVARAKSQVGYKEGPNNLTKYGQWAGIPHGYWCAMFVSWVFSCERLLPLIAQLPHGYVNCGDFEHWAIARKMTVPIHSVQLGDILIYGDKTIAEHTGIAAGPINPRTGLFPAYEGNTVGNHAGPQANGDGVYLKYRSPLWVRSVIRPAYTE